MKSVVVIEKGELAFLLSCRGVRQYFGLALEQAHGEQLQGLITGMYRKGWLYHDGSRLRICAEVAKMTVQIAEAKQVCFLFPAKEQMPLCCLYLGKNPLMMQESVGRKNGVLLQWAEPEQLEIQLQEAGIVCESVPEGVTAGKESVVADGNPAMSECAKEERNMAAIMTGMPLGRLKNRGELKVYREITMLIEKLDCSNGAYAKQFCFWREGLHDYLVERDMVSDVMCVTPVTKEALQRLWDDLCGAAEV